MPETPAPYELHRLLHEGDLPRLRTLLAVHPELSIESFGPLPGHPRGATPLAYVAMLRFDARRHGLATDLQGTGAMAELLVEAGAPVNGQPADRETPLITAASYGDADVARVLILAGADLEAVATADAGGVPGGTALEHSAVFGMTDVVDLLVGAGARVTSFEMAAAAGDIDGWPLTEEAGEARIRALVFAADHQRLAVIDALVKGGTPIDAVDSEWGRQPLRVATENGRAASVEQLLALGADASMAVAPG